MKFRKSPTRKLSLKSGILPKIRIETTENIFPDTKNAFLAAREDTNDCVAFVSNSIFFCIRFWRFKEDSIMRQEKVDLF